MKSDALPIAFTESGLAFSDGTEIKADVVVFATGFVGNMRLHVERLFGEEVGEKAGDCFGVNEEGEILGAFKPLPRKYCFDRDGQQWLTALCNRTRTVVYWWHLGIRKVLLPVHCSLHQGYGHGCAVAGVH